MGEHLTRNQTPISRPRLTASSLPTVRRLDLAAMLAARRIDFIRQRSTSGERSPMSQTQIDTSRHGEAIYGSEAWGFKVRGGHSSTFSSARRRGLGPTSREIVF